MDGTTDTSRTARDLRAIVRDGAWFSAMVGLGETYVPAFALAVGFGEIVAGLVATLPMLAGALFQLVTPWAVRHLGSYRRWVVGCAVLQALSFGPLIVGAARGTIGLEWLAVATIAYWAFGMATSPAWNAWITSLVPIGIRPAFFAKRSRIAHVALFLAILAGGLALEGGRARHAELDAFVVLFAAAMVARFGSAAYLGRQSEAPGLAAAHRAQPPRAIRESLRAAGSGRVLAYLLGMQVVVYTAAPFFTPYMLGPLGCSYVEFMALTATAFLARVLVLPALGRIAHGRGTLRVMWFGAFGIVPLPLLWLASDSFAYLLAVQALSGAAWAALELATLLSFFEGIPERDRTSVLTAFNLGNAAAIVVGALAGSQVFAMLEGSLTAYAWLFGVSAVGRFGMLLVLRGARAPRHDVTLELRTLAVRPAVGAVERPIVASVVQEDES